ncbi:MAG TPA: hypothetical protein PKW63_12900, partial [Vicinamibacterales bacterium]|nr:hypothetical protein [Vicinamibacterales bacterium]
MSKARNDPMTLEQQIQPLTTKDIRPFFPTMICPQFAISDICDIWPLQGTSRRLHHNGPSV